MLSDVIDALPQMLISLSYKTKVMILGSIEQPYKIISFAK